MASATCIALRLHVSAAPPRVGLTQALAPMKAMPRSSRSRRLRKKLRVDEFQQFGFWVEFQLSSRLTTHQTIQFWDSFITEAVEANLLTYGGSEIGFVVPEGNFSATESHRHPPPPNNSFKPTPRRGVNSVLCATLHAVATPLRGGLTQALCAV